MSRLFADAFHYKAWANRALLDDGERQWTALPDEDARFFARILNHAHVVDRIFIDHLIGKPHGFDADNTVATPTIAALRTAVAQTYAWLIDRAADATSKEPASEIGFEFTDGGRARKAPGWCLSAIATLLVTRMPRRGKRASVTGSPWKARSFSRLHTSDVDSVPRCTKTCSTTCAHGTPIA